MDLAIDKTGASVASFPLAGDVVQIVVGLGTRARSYDRVVRQAMPPREVLLDSMPLAEAGGDGVIMSWHTNEASWTGAVSVGPVPGQRSLSQVRLLEEARRRRTLARAEVSLPGHLMVAASLTSDGQVAEYLKPPLECQVLDISGGGSRLYLLDRSTLEENSAVLLVLLPVPGRPSLHLPGRGIRIERSGAGGWEATVIFDPDARRSQAIARLVTSALAEVEQRARAADPFAGF